MKRFDQINVIPFIDIMLVLLAIVLTTATFISQNTMDINLPEAHSDEQAQAVEGKTLEISINAENRVFLDGESTGIEVLAEKLATLNKNTSIVLRVDKQVRFEWFVRVVDELKKNQLQKLTILTQATQDSL